MRRLADPVLNNLAERHAQARMPVEQAPAPIGARSTHLEALGRLARGHRAVDRAAADDTQRRAGCARSTPTSRGARSRAPSIPRRRTSELHPRSAAARRRGVPRAGPAARAARAARSRSTRRRHGSWWPRSNRRGRSRRLQQLAAVLGDGRSRPEERSARPGTRLRVDYALRQHDQWYKGDGAYGDGPEFHWDYYNSFVIHPMLLDVLDACARRVAGVEGDRARASVDARDATPRSRSGSSRPTAASRRSADRSPIAAARSSCSRRRRCGARCRRRVAGAGPRRADRGDSPDARSAGHVRCERLAAHRLLRPPARRRRNLHLDGQPVSVRRRPAAARPAGRRTSSGPRRRSRGRR